MAALRARVTSGAVALLAATAKTVLRIKAPTNQRVKVTSLAVSLDGATSTAVPIAVRVLRQTTDGTGTAATPVLVEPEMTEAIQATAIKNASAEPTAGDVLKSGYVPAFGGVYEVFFPLGQEIVIGGGGRLGIECTAPAGVNVQAEIEFEE